MDDEQYRVMGRYYKFVGGKPRELEILVSESDLVKRLADSHLMLIGSYQDESGKTTRKARLMSEGVKVYEQERKKKSIFSRFFHR